MWLARQQMISTYKFQCTHTLF